MFLSHCCHEKSTTELQHIKMWQKYLIFNAHSLWQTAVYILHITQGLLSPYRFIQLCQSKFAFCFFVFWGVGRGDIRISVFVSLCFQRTHCFLSLTRTDSDVKMHCSEAIHSWLAMAPAREHTPHNNELLRPPEDTMPAQRIEIKRQVRHKDCRWGKGAGSGGYEFNIQQMLNI